MVLPPTMGQKSDFVLAVAPIAVAGLYLLAP